MTPEPLLPCCLTCLTCTLKSKLKLKCTCHVGPHGNLFGGSFDRWRDEYWCKQGKETETRVGMQECWAGEAVEAGFSTRREVLMLRNFFQPIALQSSSRSGIARCLMKMNIQSARDGVTQEKSVIMIVSWVTWIRILCWVLSVT